MRQVDVVQFGDHLCGWGEGLCWDPDTQLLHLVDCLRNVRGETTLDAPDDLRLIPTPTLPTKVLLSDKADRHLIVLDDGIFAMAETADAYGQVAAMPQASSGRFNDATVDPAGRIITGNLGLKANTDGSYWSWQGDGGAGNWSTIATKKGNANGPCFSNDGRTLYFADSPTGNILRYDYDPETGTASNETVLANTFELGGGPDGAAIDTDGYLWSALFGGGVIARYAPDGTLDGTIAVPVRNPTDIVFAGPNLDRMIVVSAMEQPTDDREPSPLAGASFEITGAGVTGLPIGKVRL
ncbi:MAG: SMP-30/gluconolactonase/LRE family protein [Alphaproteobacteria bacterium]|nr:SMP-30/gluconolactonase/LRE family protein [Alphaproteobacteria bacterium]